MTPEDFINAIRPGAMECERTSGIPHEFTIAQGALESGWGASVLAVRGFNLFGVKADASWTGDVLTLPTREFLKGKWVTISAKWRKYASWAECITDHAAFFHKNRRYAHALTLTDPVEFARAIQRAGYATDPQYADKLISIMKGHKLV